MPVRDTVGRPEAARPRTLAPLKSVFAALARIAASIAAPRVRFFALAPAIPASRASGRSRGLLGSRRIRAPAARVLLVLALEIVGLSILLAALPNAVRTLLLAAVARI